MGVNLAWPSLLPASHPRVDHLLLPQNLQVLFVFYTTMISEATVPWGSFNLALPQNFPGQNHLGTTYGIFLLLDVTPTIILFM